MQQLLSIAHINDTELKSILSRIQGEELLRLSEPCYYPKLGELDPQLIDATGLTKQNIDDFAERTWKGRPGEKFNIFRDASFLVWLMWYFLNQDDIPIFNSALICHMIRQYQKLYKKYFRTGCDSNAFISALDRLSKSHLFFREGSIPSAISKLSNDLARKYEQGIKNWNLDAIAKFIGESRSRLNQSFRSFANLYYKIINAPGYGIPSNEALDDQVNPYTLNRRDQFIYNVVSRICMEGDKDQQTIDEAKRITKISDSMATALVDELSNGTNPSLYSVSLQNILNLLLTQPQSRIEDITIQLMSIKRTTKPVYFKKEIQGLTSSLVKNSGRKQEFDSLTPQTQFRIAKYLAVYIAMVLRNTLSEMRGISASS